MTQAKGAIDRRLREWVAPRFHHRTPSLATAVTLVGAEHVNRRSPKAGIDRQLGEALTAWYPTDLDTPSMASSRQTHDVWGGSHRPGISPRSTRISVLVFGVRLEMKSHFASLLERGSQMSAISRLEAF
jgi:hypothetical protein